MPDDPDDTNDLVYNLRPDDPETYNRLIAHAYRRLEWLIYSMLRDFGGVRRWDDTGDVTGDVLHSALIRLHKAFSESELELTSARHFYQVAANYIRWELLSLAEKYRGPQGSAANHHTDSTGGAVTGAADPDTGPDQLLRWADFQRKAMELPPDLREVFDLIWCHRQSHKEAADILGVSERTVKRRWLVARLALYESCKAMNFDWLGCADPVRLLEYVRDGASERKLRLFAVACCRGLGALLGNEANRTAVDVSERLADGVATAAQLTAARRAARQVAPEYATIMSSSRSWERLAAAAACHAAGGNAWRACRKTSELVVECLVCRAGDHESCNVTEVRTVELARQSALVRDIFADPVRPVRFDARWRTADVIGLAEGIYQDRAFDRLPILADALMDAGCADEDLLGHCRNNGLHARGCWVVDLALGKK